jgi:two-component system, OmpR family, response regulator
MKESKKTILLVDDDSDYLFQTRMNIEQFGFHVVTADSQKEAEALIEKIKPDLAILDLMMEKDDSGFVLAFKLKNKYPDVPVIIATAVASETGMSFGLVSEEDRKWIRADLYLEKGVRADQLHREIVKLLKL